MWLNQISYFVEQDSSSYPWFSRGGYFGDGSYAGLLCVRSVDGSAISPIGDYYDSAFRVALAPTV